MFSVTRLVDVPADSRARVRDSLMQVANSHGPRHALVTPTSPGSRNGGDLLVHLRFEHEDDGRAASTGIDAALADASVTRVNGADYPGTPTIITDRSRGTVYRTLLLRVESDVDDATVSRFEDDLRLLPRYVSSIAAWQLSRPVHTVGAAAWTHVFEQEFSDTDGLMGPYLMHPIHWTVVDQWFDPECPNVIVRERVCHSFGDAPVPVLR